MHVIRGDGTTDLNPSELKQFFISHLNRIFCAKSQLEEKLPVIAGSAHSHDLRLAVSPSYAPESCLGLVGFLDEAFQSIGPPLDGPSLRDLSILFYMQNIESIEMVSFEVMMRVADKLHERSVVELLRECYIEARQDQAMFSSISGKYI
jgi:ferritin-like metal-binding protein YciE